MNKLPELSDSQCRIILANAKLDIVYFIERILREKLTERQRDLLYLKCDELTQVNEEQDKRLFNLYKIWKPYQKKLIT